MRPRNDGKFDANSIFVSQPMPVLNYVQWNKVVSGGDSFAIFVILKHQSDKQIPNLVSFDDKFDAKKWILGKENCRVLAWYNK